MGKRINRQSDLQQIPIAYPPQATGEQYDTWMRCKLLYKEHIILLADHYYYFTLSDDAAHLHQLAGCAMDDSGAQCICYFPKGNINEVFEAANAAGLFLAVCEVPEDPSSHLFN
jgi:hypothetical protein